MIVKGKWIAVLAAAWLGTAAVGQELDARLTNSQGKALNLAALWGKPTVLFYEDKDSVGLNQPLKDELTRRATEQGLLERATVIAIANVQGFDWFPARNLALNGARAMEQKLGVPVYLDWHGALGARPWALPRNGSSVVVLDRHGQVRFRKTGPLSPAEIAHVFALLGELRET